jgi:DNA-binding SARP family transcriptional activator/DNA-binding CsgD family transcriptional regulator
MATSKDAGAEGPATLWIKLLGWFQVRVGTRDIPELAWGRKAAGLIKLLALTPDHRLHRDQVQEALWPEATPAAGANRLHRTLHSARRTLEPDLRHAGQSAYLQLHGNMLILASSGAMWVDIDAFATAHLRAHRQMDPAAYHRALDLYTGDLLPEERYEEWAVSRREELRAMYLDGLLELAHLHEERGELEAAIQVLRRLVVSEPAHEEASVRLIRLYAQDGERYQALHQYQHLREALKREFDAEPTEVTERLYQRIRTGWYPMRERRANELLARTAVPDEVEPAPHVPSGPQHTGDTAPASLLTRRQYQVALLIAEGLTNREIAARLGIAKRTVDAHVGHILAKLHLTSRTQLPPRLWQSRRWAHAAS